MKGDFSRDTFDPDNHFSRVLMQQGRVQIDADWNEQTSILLHYLRTLARDVLGPYAGPASDLGFEIIAPGTVPAASLPAKLAAIEPDLPRRKVLEDGLKGGDIIIGPGRYYVRGVLVENERAILYSAQPGFPFDDKTKPDHLKDWKAGLLFYLDVWERHITYVEDDRIREVALRGPDTCTRAEVVWQVKVLLQAHATSPPPGQQFSSPVWSTLRGRIYHDNETIPGFECRAVEDLLPLGTGRLRARARRDKPPTELCVIPPESAYRGAENQLYRVEIHRDGTAAAGKTGATFKWSREDGSVIFPIRSLSGGTAVLEHLGRDRHLSLEPGDWVEVIDDTIALGEHAGPLAQVDTVDRDELTVTLTYAASVVPLSPLPSYHEADTATKHPLLRRWDHRGDPNDKDLNGALQITERADTDLTSDWIELEDGVQICFAAQAAPGAQYLAGDYWLIPARTATGDVDWAHELGADGKPKHDADGNPIGVARPAHGPRHYFAPLLLLDGTGIERRMTDCRCRIEPPPCPHYPHAFAGQAIGPL